MQLTYTLTEQDYIDFNLYTFKTSKTMKRGVLRQRIIGPVIFMAASRFAPRILDIPAWFSYLIFGLASIAWVIYYPKKIEKHLVKTIKKRFEEGDNHGLLAETVLIMDEEGLHFQNDYNESFVKWSVVNKIEESESHIYLFNSSISAHIIPKMAFSSTNEMEEFRRQVDTRILG